MASRSALSPRFRSRSAQCQTEPRLRQLVSWLLGDCEGKPPREAVVRITLLREAAVLLSLRRNTESRLWGNTPQPAVLLSLWSNTLVLSALH